MRGASKWPSDYRRHAEADLTLTSLALRAKAEIIKGCVYALTANSVPADAAAGKHAVFYGLVPSTFFRMTEGQPLANTRRLEAWTMKFLPTPMRRRLQGASGENRAIVRGMVWVAVFLLVAKAVAAAKEMLVAYRYGAGAVVDGYLFVFNLAQWPCAVFASVTGIILIPFLVKLQQERPSEASRLQAALLPFAFLLGAAVSLLFGAIMWWAVSRMELGLTAESQAAALTALPWIAPSIAFAFMGAVLSNWLMSQRRHANTLLEATPAAAIAVCLLVWPIASGQPLGVLPLAVATLIGFPLQTLLLVRLCGQPIGFAHFGTIAEHWPALRKAFGIMLLAQIIFTSAGLLDQFFAVRMGEGVLAIFAYAQRIMALVLGLTTVVVGRAMLPVFASVGDLRASFALAQRWAWRFGALGILCAVAVVLTAEWAVMLLFERGAFTAKDTQEVAQILRVLALQLPFYLFGIVLVQWLGAAGKAFWLFMAAVVGFLAKLFSAWVWFDLWGQGLAASTALMYAVSSIMIYGTARYLLRLERVK
jgi:peptidoglycan biosynthesis protein MviN/MurJ (putative lipid II flippase)